MGRLGAMFAVILAMCFAAHASGEIRFGRLIVFMLHQSPLALLIAAHTISCTLFDKLRWKGWPRQLTI